MAGYDVSYLLGLSPTVDDEEEMLYGDSSSLFSPSKEEARRSNQPPADRDPAPFRADPTHWCLLVRENGTMEVGASHTSNSTTAQKPLLPLLTIASLQIYQLPDWRLVFLVKNFPVGQRVLVDSSFGQPTTQGEVRKEEATRQGELPLVKEVLLVALGSRQSRPYLLVSTFLPPRAWPRPSHPPHTSTLTIVAWTP